MKSWSVGWKVVVGVGILFLGVGAFIGFSDWRSQRVLDAGMERAKAAGVATEFSDLMNDVPDAENGWLVMKDSVMDESNSAYGTVQVTSEVMGSFASGLPINLGDDPSNVSTREEALTEAKTWEEKAADIEKGVRMVGFSFNRDYQDGVNTLFGEFAGMKAWAKYFANRARMKAKLGDLSGSIRDLETGFLLSDRAGVEMNFISKLVQIAGRAIMMRAGLDCVDEDDSGEILEAYLVLLDGLEPVDMAEGFAGEGVIVVETMLKGVEMVGFEGMGGGGSWKALLPLNRKALTGSVLDSFGELKEKLIEGEPYENYQVVAAHEWPRFPALSREQQYFYDAIIPMDSAFLAVVKDWELRKMHALIARVLDYENRTGRKPDGLAVFDGVDKTDGFGNGEYGYWVDGDSFGVYSVYVDGIDDGGRFVEGGEEKPGDLVVGRDSEGRWKTQAGEVD